MSSVLALETDSKYSMCESDHGVLLPELSALTEPFATGLGKGVVPAAFEIGFDVGHDFIASAPIGIFFIGLVEPPLGLLG